MTPNTPEWAALTERLDKLEKQNARLKRIGIVVIVLAASVLLMGQAPGWRTVEANEFVLKDSKGRVRAKLTTAFEGTADVASMFMLLDENEKPRVSFLAGGDSAVMGFTDVSGKERANLTLDKQGPQFWLSRPNEQRALALLVDEFGNPRFVLFDANGKNRTQLAAGPTGSGLVIYGPDGGGREEVHLGSGGNGPTFRLVDKEGFEATIGTTNLVTHSTGETHKTSAASVVLFDKNKNVLWKAP